MKNTYRFFVPPASFHGALAEVADPELAHQLGRVLRLEPGDRVLLLDGAGTAYEVELTAITRAGVTGAVLTETAAGGEPAIALTLYLALLRAERFEWALQKAVELGAAQIVPVQFARSLAAERAEPKKLTRWSRIVREAAEQACRGRLPTLAEPLSFAGACAAAARSELPLLLWEGQAPPLRDTVRHTRPAPRAIALLSGPEGGITPDELTSARENGIIPVSLGPRILRAETAPLAALAALLYELE